MSPDIAQLNATRTEVLLRQATKIAERIRRFEHDGLTLFGDYYDNRDQLADEGVAFDIEMTAGLAAWFSHWKQHKAREAGRELVREELADWTPLEDLVK